MLNKSMLLLSTILTLLGYPAKAQSHEKLLTVFIYNFAINGEWTHKDETSDFIIGVVNGGPDGEAMAKELQQMAAAKMIGRRKITVMEFARESDVIDCHILFIPESRSGLLQSLTAKLSTTSTLIVTEKAGLAKLGSGINFITVDGKLRYEINTQEIDRRRIKISTKIVSLGLPV